MNRSILFSIIVPIYNREEYLRQCIQSIVNQDGFDQSELILIDDGSTDKSSEICFEYKQKYLNIKYIYQNNQGLSIARNVGLKHAEGKYILFVDSDDYLEENALSILSKYINTYDIEILTLESKTCEADGSDIKNINDNKYTDGIYSGEKKLKKLKKLKVSVWRYVYQKKFLVENSLTFAPGIMHEDNLWSISWMPLAKTIIDTKSHLYVRRYSQNSIIRSKNLKKAEDLVVLAELTIAKALEYKARIPQWEFRQLVKYSAYMAYASLYSCFTNCGDLHKFGVENRSKILLYLKNDIKYLPIWILLKFNQYGLIKMILKVRYGEPT